MDEWSDEESEDRRQRETRQSEFLIRMIMAMLGAYAALSAMVIAKGHWML